MNSRIDVSAGVPVECGCRADWNRWIKLMRGLRKCGLRDNIGTRVAEAGDALARIRLYVARIQPGVCDCFLMPDGDGLRPIWRACQAGERALWQFDGICAGRAEYTGIAETLRDARKAMKSVVLRLNACFGV